jgi:hypothetical protein
MDGIAGILGYSAAVVIARALRPSRRNQTPQILQARVLRQLGGNGAALYPVR